MAVQPNQSSVQADIRAITGSAWTYEGDWHSLWDMAGIRAGTFNERMLLWINFTLGTAYGDLMRAMQAFAVTHSSYNWSSMASIGTPPGLLWGGQPLNWGPDKPLKWGLI